MATATVSKSAPAWNGSPTLGGLYDADESSPRRTLKIGATYGFLIVSVNADGSETYEGLISGHHSDPFQPFSFDATEAVSKCLKEGFGDGTSKTGDIYRAYEIASITLTGRHMLERCDPQLAQDDEEEEGDDDEAEPQGVIIVPKPDDWEPTGPQDVPPGIERMLEESPKVFAASFNRSEMENSKGWWAVPVASIPASKPKLDEAIAEAEAKLSDAMQRAASA